MVRYSCYQNTMWKRDVDGSKGAIYTVMWKFQFDTGEHAYECSCPAFKFRKPGVATCKHIEKVKAERCTWNVDLQLEDQTTVCPWCRGLAVATEVVLVDPEGGLVDG